MGMKFDAFNFSSNGKKKRNSPKHYMTFLNTVRENMPDVFAWESTPIYLREYNFDIWSAQFDYGVDNCHVQRIFDKKRKSYSQLKDDILQYLTNQMDFNLQMKDIWRFLDLSLKRDKDLKISETFSNFEEMIELAKEYESDKIKSIQEDISRIYHDPQFYPYTKAETLKELQKQEFEQKGKERLLTSAYTMYKNRNVEHSSKYVPNVLVNRVYNSIYPILTESEKHIVDWAEENIPGVTKKFLSAILNQSKFISVNYLLPSYTIVSSGELQKLYRYRGIILNKLFITSSKRSKRGSSSTLNYNEYTLNFLDSIIPGYKNSGLSTLLQKINEYKEQVGVSETTNCSNSNSIIEAKVMLDYYKKQNRMDLYETAKKMYERAELYSSTISSFRVQLLTSLDEVKNIIEERKKKFELLVSGLLT